MITLGNSIFRTNMSLYLSYIFFYLSFLLFLLFFSFEDMTYKVVCGVVVRILASDADDPGFFNKF